jgi:hypothetical protein
VVIQVVDVRTAGERPVLDLAVLVGDLAILLPGPGAPSGRWAAVAPDAASIAVLPGSAVSWARALPPRNWLLLVGEARLERARGASGVPFLMRHETGSVEVTVRDGGLAVRTERCSGGRQCVVELPPPALTTLDSGAAAVDTTDDAETPVQSGRIGDDRRSIR